jgi:adhesin transport system outer membrane protein
LREDRGHDLNGIIGQSNVRTAEVVLNWNLLNGFSDVARSRQYAEQGNVARDLRDKACRDIRQTLAIAYNDTRKLTEQLTYLDQHQLSIEKARDAYRKQFDIGQRTLLDLLDTENELFQARRAYVNADLDLTTAYSRAHAGFGNLLSALGLSRIDKEPLAELADWSAGEEGATQCPAEGPRLYSADKAALDARAQEMLKEAMAAAALAAAPPAAPASPVVDTSQEKAVADAIKAWLAAWTSRNIDSYLAAYAPGFAPADGASREKWEKKRRTVLGRAGDISLDIVDLQIKVWDPQHAVASFRQNYHAAGFSDVVMKTLELERIDSKWLVVAETTQALP